MLLSPELPTLTILPIDCSVKIISHLNARDVCGLLSTSNALKSFENKKEFQQELNKKYHSTSFTNKPEDSISKKLQQVYITPSRAKEISSDILKSLSATDYIRKEGCLFKCLNEIKHHDNFSDVLALLKQEDHLTLQTIISNWEKAQDNLHFAAARKIIQSFNFASVPDQEACLFNHLDKIKHHDNFSDVLALLKQEDHLTLQTIISNWERTRSV